VGEHENAWSLPCHRPFGPKRHIAGVRHGRAPKALCFPWMSGVHRPCVPTASVHSGRAEVVAGRSCRIDCVSRCAGQVSPQGHIQFCRGRKEGEKKMSAPAVLHVEYSAENGGDRSLLGSRNFVEPLLAGRPLSMRNRLLKTASVRRGRHLGGLRGFTAMRKSSLSRVSQSDSMQ